MITIKEIAQKLGVSPTTVSNVINGRTQKMSDKTRKMIEEMLVKNHYVQDTNTRSTNAELKLILVQLFFGNGNKTVFTDPFCAELYEAIQNRAQLNGRCVITNTFTNEDDFLKKLSKSNVEGAIVLGCAPEKCKELTKRTIKPLVFIDCGYGEYDNIGLRDKEGAYELTSYMIRQGHKKIAFFCDQKIPQSSNEQRFLGFKEALKKNKINFCDDDFYYIPTDKNLRYEVFRQFAESIKKKGYTGAFFISDLYANEAISIFFSKGLDVPYDISVSGFDDNIYARLSRPTLTTVRQSPTEKGTQAVKLLFKRIYGEEVMIRSMELPAELIVRESVANISAMKK